MDTAIPVMVVILAVAGVAWPLFRPPLLRLQEAAGPASKLRALQERKQAVYGAIRELGFDFRMDKLTEEDYRDEAENLKREAVALVAKIDALRSEVPRASDAIEAEIEGVLAALRSSAAPTVVASGAVPDDPSQRLVQRFCTACGRAAVAGDRFCGGCGQALAGEGP